MVVNKNALHDIVMTYIPTKKNINESTSKKILPPPIFKGPVPTLNQSSVIVEKVGNSLIKPATTHVILTKESPKNTNQSLISNINLDQNIKKLRKKKHIEPLEKSTVERLIEHKEKSNFINNLVSKSEPNSRKKSPRSNIRINSKKHTTYMKKNIIDTKIFESEQNNKSYRDVKIKLDSSRKNKKGGSRKKSSKKSKKNSIKIKNTVPSNLRYDLERLLNDNDNIAFQRIR
jgi:hypothetical protein